MWVGSWNRLHVPVCVSVLAAECVSLSDPAVEPQGGCRTPFAWRQCSQVKLRTLPVTTPLECVCVCVCVQRVTQGSFTPEPVRLTWGKLYQLNCFSSRNHKAGVKTDAVRRGDLSQTLCQQTRLIFFSQTKWHINITQIYIFFISACRVITWSWTSLLLVRLEYNNM